MSDDPQRAAGSGVKGIVFGRVDLSYQKFFGT